MKIFVFVCVLLSLLASSQQQEGNPCDGNLTGIFVNSKQSCAGYYWCLNGIPHFAECPEGHYFNEEKQLCDFAHNVDCGIADGMTCPVEGVLTLPHPYYCEKFFLCFAGNALEQSCAPGLHFDQTNGNCNRPELADCALDICPAENDPNNIVTIPSQSSCRHYFVCVDQIPQSRSCAAGLFWDQLNQRCDLEENVVCNIDTPEIPDNGENAVTCPVDGLHFLPHPTSCSLFFVCANGVSTMSECLPGLLFNSAILKCDLEANVVCLV